MRGPEHPDFADFLYWFYYAKASMIANGLVETTVKILQNIPENETVTSMVGRVDLAFDMADKHLDQGPFFGGAEFTAADIMMVFPRTTMRRFTPRDISGLSALRAYLGRIGHRPAYRQAMARCDPGPKVDVSVEAGPGDLIGETAPYLIRQRRPDPGRFGARSSTSPLRRH